MKILAVNWLDIENPQAGGAEVHFFEIFRRLAARGNEVTLITSGFPDGGYSSTIQGITVRRIGGRHSFALKGRGAVRRALREATYDVVVEDINKLPLYLPTLTALPIYAIIPHLFGKTAFAEAPFPIASVVWGAERAVPRVYRRAAFHAISESTRDDLVERGIPASAIRVIYPGVDSDSLTPGDGSARASYPTFLYVGRLKRYKGIDTFLRAVAEARSRGHSLRLDIAGRGDDQPRLERIRDELELGDLVTFLGFVSEEKKRELMRRAWALVFPSAKEGWGISNVEAAACGTPAIASDSPGLRESVRDGETGVLVPHGDVDAATAALIRMGEDRDLVQTFGANARTFAETLSWERTATETEAHLLETVKFGSIEEKE